MATPARRASRVLMGFTISLILVFALGLRGGWIQITECQPQNCGPNLAAELLIGLFSISSLYAWWLLKKSPKAPFSNRISDIFVDLSEEELWIELEQERIETNDVERMSDAWAKLEVSTIEQNDK
ncbi:MAG: hypothetical protein VYE39_05615 [Candidatus Thermoplasmatota archaeon]|nr:hypothetical protein [Candidatus Thermoplasmatota archaeon]|tara:strand:+ start:5387 stop:5761 length:375 start_codon:yes stop_codon:yes gene_type:complete